MKRRSHMENDRERPPNSKFLADGHKRSAREVGRVCLPRIRTEVEAEFTNALASSGPLYRCWLRLRMQREIRRRLTSEIHRHAPPDAMYAMR